MRSPILVVTAVETERSAVLTGLAAGPGLRVRRLPDRNQPESEQPREPVRQARGQEPWQGPQGTSPATVDVAVAGVGAPVAAAATARLLALAEADGRPYRSVVSAGIAGGFAGRAELGELVIASQDVQADLGADSPDGFIDLDQLGFGSARVPIDAGLLEWLRAALPESRIGEVLTVSTVTGTDERAGSLARAHPLAVAEAMEGYGVGCAALAAGVAFAEVRAISNLVGPRDRAAWRIPDALTGLSGAFGALVARLEVFA